jgi:hypothetical protein
MVKRPNLKNKLKAKRVGGEAQGAVFASPRIQPPVLPKKEKIKSLGLQEELSTAHGTPEAIPA